MQNVHVTMAVYFCYLLSVSLFIRVVAFELLSYALHAASFLQDATVSCEKFLILHNVTFTCHSEHDSATRPVRTAHSHIPLS
jgi:hypothetical protein